MKQQTLPEQIQQINDRIRQIKQLILRQHPPRYLISLLTNPPPKLPHLPHLPLDNHLRNQQMKQFLLYFRIK